MSLYSVCVSGYEDYSPVWFESKLDKEGFQRLVSDCIHVVVKRLASKNKDYINGHAILDKLVIMLPKNGCKIIKPEVEIDLEGECSYNDEYETVGRRAKIFSDEDWKIILDHNKKIYDEVNE